MDFEDMMLDDGELTIDAEMLEKDLIAVDQTLPEQLYLIPIRYRPIFPGIVTPLIISQGRFTDAIEKIMKNSRTIGLILIRDDEKESVNIDDLYEYGTAVKIFKKINLPDGGINVLINSVKRFKIKKVISEKKYIIADVNYLEDKNAKVRDKEMKALTREVLGQLKKLSDNNPLFTEEMKLTMLNVDEPGKIADFVTSILNIEKEDYQEVLETLDVKKRLNLVLRLLHNEMEVMDVQRKIQKQINEKVDKQQKDFFLREQLKVIKEELGIDGNEKSKEIKEMKKKAEELSLEGEANTKIMEEIEKYSSMEPGSSEYVVSRNYIDTFLALPWKTLSEDNLDLFVAEKILDKDHFGLEDVKKRIVEFLAVKKIKPDSKGSIICLVGPPGVGKTSLGKSIARALSRKFFRLSLGGMRDEAEIKGHRRTYVGSMPGKIVQGLKITKTRNPVFMLDEIDKLGQSFQGDPASALLEVLDPEQNVEFRDYYLDVPFNLSDVLFITTANTLDSIPSVLLDRMEVIRLSGYIADEKFNIAKKYLLPKQMKEHGLKKGTVKLDKKGFLSIINGWAREAGVRNLERQIEKICRKTATLIAKEQKLPEGVFDYKRIKEYLGTERYLDEELLKINQPGMTIGLAWTSVGGVTLVIESIGVKSSGKGDLKLTGHLGKVMSESANIAYSYVQSILNDNEKYFKFFNENILHIHVPAGATPKDGPSAGITIASSIYSLVTGKILKKGTAMTGELTLTGRVLPVGGVKEKVIAAHKAGLKHIILSRENEKDLSEIPEYVKKGLNFYFVEIFEEVVKIAF